MVQPDFLMKFKQPSVLIRCKNNLRTTTEIKLLMHFNSTMYVRHKGKDATTPGEMVVEFLNRIIVATLREV